MDICYQVSNLISSYRHGFRKKCSNTTSLVHLSTFVYRGFFHQQETDVTCTDFSKALDKVNHVLLKKKLYLMEFTNLSLISLALFKNC